MSKTEPSEIYGEPLEPFPEPSSDDEKILAPHEIWWALLRARIQDVALTIPEDLKGVIQFEINREDELPAYFFLWVNGPKVESFSGMGFDVDAWVEANEVDLEAMLKSEATSKDALGVRGEHSWHLQRA